MMAPSQTQNDALKTVEGHLRDVIQTLYEISVGVYGYQGPESTEVLINQIQKLTSQYHSLPAASAPLDVSIPQEVIQYIEDGRNPDIYTREFVEIVVKQNQFMKGKMEAYRQFRDVLGDQICVAFPELKEDVDKIVDASGGRQRRSSVLAVGLQNSMGGNGKGQNGSSA
ncbi:RNA polymerase II mediator complex subunit [Rhizina undulata]